MNITDAIVELRKHSQERKFDQTVELIINLKGIDLKRDNISLFANLPHKIKEKKVCAFLNEKSKIVDTVIKTEFGNYKDKKPLKVFVKKYDFFIASASLMPLVAATFGKALGPSGKMPSPQLGILMQENEQVIKETLLRIEKAVKVRVKEPSVKVAIGKMSMSDKDIAENVQAAYTAIAAGLPKKKENVKNVMLRLTMTKPVKLEVQ